MKRFTHILSFITVLVALTGAKTAAQNLDAGNPLGFFTNAASRLLSSEMNLNLMQIEIYPANQYTPAVHRLLQVAANVYDATTTNFYPDIFRPLFTVDGSGNVFISGYTNQPSLVTQANQMVPGANNDILDPPVEAAALPVGQNILTNVYGVPWIIGAKKGFPNFNAFSVESAFQLVRKLEVVRDTNAMPQPDIIWTNQMYLMNITNYMGLSCWNSYRSNYPGPVDILVRCSSIMTLTNDNNMFPYVFMTNFAFATEIAPNWPAWNGVPKQPSSSFLVPLNTSILTLTNAIYFYNEPNPPNGAEFLSVGSSPGNYLDAGIRELPHFVLLMTNRLQVAIIDYSTNASPLNASGPVVGRIVDYVQLDGLNSSQPLNSTLSENDPDSCWNTNYDANGNLLGVQNQIYISADGTTIDGNAPIGSGAWNFPTGQISNPNWLGQVHRGTPWQTIYLKSTNILDWASNAGQTGTNTWVSWTGDENLADASAMAPVQDWRLASLLSSLLNTNNPSSLVSVNNPDPNAWLVLCNGLTVLTNISTDLQIRFPQLVPPQFAALVVSSNSPQALIIFSAIESARMSQPGQSFANIGDILAIPQLAEQSPFLNVSSAIQRTNGISDAAYEAISSQLLPLLRADSVGSAAAANGRAVIQFTGSDGHVYAIETSPDLVDWTRISTNWPAGGMVNFTNSPALGIGAQFYRSIMLQ